MNTGKMRWTGMVNRRWWSLEGVDPSQEGYRMLSAEKPRVSTLPLSAVSPDMSAPGKAEIGQNQPGESDTPLC